MNKTTKARIMLIASMTIFGTLAPFVRSISVSSGELALYRAVLAALLLAAFMTVTKQKIPFGRIKKQIPLLLVSGICMGANWILLFEAYKYTTVSAATLSYYFAPVIVAAVCPFLFREIPGKTQIICLLMSALGLFLITVSGDMEKGGRDIIGILLGLGAAVLYAAVVILNKFIRDTDGIHRTFMQIFSAAVTLVPYVAATSGFSLGSLDQTGWINLLIVGIIHTGITYCMYFSSLKELPGQNAAVLSYVDPLVAVIISVTVLGEPMSLRQIAGGVLILGFTLLNELSTGTKKR